MHHLLWSSDRLEIAREVDSRLTRIYADLVSLEKMMHYKRSIIDVLKDALPAWIWTRAQADARGGVPRPLGGQRAEPAEPCGQKGGAPMKRNLLITAVLLALLPRVAQAQWTFDIVSVEAYINDHKKQRSLLLARSTLEYSNQLLHEYSRKEIGEYKELNVDLDRYTRALRCDRRDVPVLAHGAERKKHLRRSAIGSATTRGCWRTSTKRS